MKKPLLNLVFFSLLFSCNDKLETYIDFEQIDIMINNEILQNNIPGAVVLIGDEKEIFFQKAYGI